MLQKLMFWKKKPKAQLSDQEKAKLQEINTRMADLRSVTFIFFLFLILVLCSAYFSVFEIDKLGQFGDSFGVLTSFFTGLAFVGLMITIRLQQQSNQTQQEELRLNREEMHLSSQALQEQSKTLKLQQAESTFFTLLEHTGKSLNSFESNQSGIPNIAAKLIGDFKIELYTRDLTRNSPEILITDIEEISKKFRPFHLLNLQHFGQLDRNIGTILEFIDSNELLQTNRLYIQCIQNMLGLNTASLLAYFAISPYFSSHRTPSLIIKYGLLDGVDLSGLPADHIELVHSEIIRPFRMAKP